MTYLEFTWFAQGPTLVKFYLNEFYHVRWAVKLENIAAAFVYNILHMLISVNTVKSLQ